MIAPAAAASYVYRDRPSIFGIATLASEQFTTVVAELGPQGAKTLALLKERTYPAAACDAVPSLASQAGVEVVLSFTFQSEDLYGEADSLFRALSQSNPDVVLACTFPRLCQSLHREIQNRQLHASALVFTTCATSGDGLSELGDARRYLTSITPWLPSFGLKSQVSKWSSQEFAAAYFEAYHEEAGYQAAAGWAAMETLVHALQMADSPEPGEIAKVLRSIDITTLYGRVAFNSDGQNTNDWKVVQYFPESEVAQLVAPAAAAARRMAYPRPPWNVQACFDYPRTKSGAVRASMKCKVGFNGTGHCGSCGMSQVAVWRKKAWQQLDGCKCQRALCLPGEVLFRSECKACPPGRFVHESGFCVDCAPGAYSDEIRSLSCTRCQAGRFASTAGYTTCRPCSAGRASEAGSTHCRDCHRGTHTSEPGMSQCVQCQHGTYSEDEGTRHCKTCAPGTVSVWGGYNCTQCSVGKYQSRAGMSLCFNCPLGSICDSPKTVLPSTTEGWWRLRYSMGSDDQWLPCSSEDLCKADETCRTGHTGVLCEVCMPGYFKNHRLIHCEECKAWFFHISMAMIFGTLVTVIIYISTAMSVESTGKASAITDALLKLLFNYITSLSITAGVFQAIFIESMRQHLYETGKLHDSFPIILNSALLRLSFTEFYSWLVPAECIFQPSVSEDDQEWTDVLAAANVSSSLTWIEALAGMHHTETLADLEGVDGTFQVPAHLALAQKRLQDHHWTSAFRQQLFWFFVPVFVLAMVTLIGFFLVMLFLCLRRRRNRKVIEFLDLIAECGFRTAARGHSREDCYYFLEVADRRLLGLYPVIRYARMFQGPKRLMIQHYLEDSEPLMIVSLFFLYPTMVETLLQPLRCKFPFNNIGDGLGGHDFMIFSPNLQCYKSDDALFWLSILGMLIYTIGVPAFGAWKLYKNRFNLSRHFNQTWGFLMSGYEISMRHWECLLLFRKSLTLVLVSISMLDGLRLLLLMLTSATFTLAHIWYAPFDNRFNELLDRVETRHLLVWVLFCIGILWTYLEADTRESRESLEFSVYAVSIIVAILHAWFMYMILRQIVRHGSASYAEHIVKQRKKEDMVTAEMQAMENSSRVLSQRSKKSRRKAARRPSQDNSGNLVLLDLTTPEGFLQHVRQLTLRDISRNWRNLLFWFQSCLFGTWAGRHYQKYLDRKPYLVCDPRETWFMLMGVHSFENAQEPGRISRLSESKMPGSAKAPNEKQRRYLVKIIEEVFEYLIVNQNFDMFSPTLLEFMFRVGFAFDEDCALRTAAQRQCAIKDAEKEEETSLQGSSRRDSQISQSSDVDERCSTSDGVEYEKVSESDFAAADSDLASADSDIVAADSYMMIESSTALPMDTPEGGSPHRKVPGFRSVLSHKRLSGLFSRLRSGSQGADDTSDNISRGISNASLGSNLAQAVHQAKHAGSIEFEEENPRSPQEKLWRSFSQVSQESKLSGLSDLMARSSKIQGMTEDQVHVLVDEMLRPEIFSKGVQLEELQLNLDVLRSVSRERLQLWISTFEAEWSKLVTDRFNSQHGLTDVETSPSSMTVGPSISERFDVTAYSSEASPSHTASPTRMPQLRLVFGEPSPPDTSPSRFGEPSPTGTSRSKDDDQDSSQASLDSRITSPRSTSSRDLLTSEFARSESTMRSRVASGQGGNRSRRLQANFDEWESLQYLRGFKMSDDLVAAWAHIMIRLLEKSDLKLGSLMGALATQKLHSKEALAKKRVRGVEEKVEARRAEFRQALRKAVEEQALQNKIVEKEKRKLRNALAATSKARQELRVLRDKLAAVPPLKKGGMRAALQAMREAKEQRQRFADSGSIQAPPEKPQAAVVGLQREASPEADGAVEEEDEEEAPDILPLVAERGRGQSRSAARGCFVMMCVERERSSTPR